MVENVKGAQPWVGAAKAHYGSFYLWGDVGSVNGAIAGHRPRFGETIRAKRAIKNNGGSWFGIGSPGQIETGQNPVNGVKGIATNGPSWFGDERADPRDQMGVKVASANGERRTDVGNGARFTSRDCGAEGHKQGGDWFGIEAGPSISRTTGAHSQARKAASAQIAKIPELLARHIARIYKP